jgi:hypothetical protein
MIKLSTALDENWTLTLGVPEVPRRMNIETDYSNGVSFSRWPFMHTKISLETRRWFMLHATLFEKRTVCKHHLWRRPQIKASEGIDTGKYEWRTGLHSYAAPIWPTVTYDPNTKQMRWGQTMENYVDGIIAAANNRVIECDPDSNIMFDRGSLIELLRAKNFTVESEQTDDA